ncbi:hypothetical protein Gasu2_03150 [Galdieria sulphuraria]|nr:hypothetical protein Gasu2_03150 [Galdieria sulphuraria]
MFLKYSEVQDFSCFLRRLRAKTHGILRNVSARFRLDPTIDVSWTVVGLLHSRGKLLALENWFKTIDRS